MADPDREAGCTSIATTADSTERLRTTLVLLSKYFTKQKGCAIPEILSRCLAEHTLVRSFTPIDTLGSKFTLTLEGRPSSSRTVSVYSFFSESPTKLIFKAVRAYDTDTIAMDLTEKKVVSDSGHWMTGSNNTIKTLPESTAGSVTELLRTLDLSTLVERGRAVLVVPQPSATDARGPSVTTLGFTAQQKLAKGYTLCLVRGYHNLGIVNLTIAGCLFAPRKGKGSEQSGQLQLAAVIIPVRKNEDAETDGEFYHWDETDLYWYRPGEVW